MDVSHYRDTGEYSDLTVRVDGKEFNLHKFPLFLKCDNLRKKNVNVVEFNNFPGGPFIFSLVADFCYGKCVVFTLANIIGLRCASELLEMHGEQNLSNLADDYIDDMLESALKARTMTHVLEMTSQCVEIGILAAKVRATDRCFLTVLEMYPIPCDPKSGILITAGYDDRSTVELVIDKLEKIPIEQLVSLIRLCNDKKHLWTALAHVVHDFLYRIFKVHQKKIADDDDDLKSVLKGSDLSKLDSLVTDDTGRTEGSFDDISQSTKTGGKKKRISKKDKKKSKDSDVTSLGSAASDKIGSPKSEKKGKKKKDSKDGEKSSKEKSSKEKSSKEKSSKEKSSKEKSSKEKPSKEKSSKEKSSKDKPPKDKSAKKKASKDNASVTSENAKVKKGKGKNKSNSILSDEEHNASALDSIDNLNSYFTYKQSSNFSNKKYDTKSRKSSQKISQNNNLANKSNESLHLNEINDYLDTLTDSRGFRTDTIEKRASVIKTIDNVSTLSKNKNDKLIYFKRLLEAKPKTTYDSVSDTISDTRSMPIWKYSKGCQNMGSHKTWNADNSYRRMHQNLYFPEEKTIIEDVNFEDKMKCAATSPLPPTEEITQIQAPKEAVDNKVTTERFMKKNYELLKSILKNLQVGNNLIEEQTKVTKPVKKKSNIRASFINQVDHKHKDYLSATKEKINKKGNFRPNSNNSCQGDNIKKFVARKSLSEDLYSPESLKNVSIGEIKPQKTANIIEYKLQEKIGQRESKKRKSNKSPTKHLSSKSLRETFKAKDVPVSNTKSECLISHGLNLNRKPSKSGCNPDYTVLGSSECICSVLEKRQKKLNKLQKSFETIQNKRQMLKDLCQKNSPLKNKIKQQKQGCRNNANDMNRGKTLLDNSISSTNPSCTPSLSTSITMKTYNINDDELDSIDACSEIQSQYNCVDTNQNNISEHIKKGSCRFVQVPINTKINVSNLNNKLINQSNELGDISNISSAFNNKKRPNAGVILDSILQALPDRKLLNHLMSGEWLKMALITAHRYKCECWDMLLDVAAELLFEFDMNELRSLPVDLLVQIMKRALGMNQTNPKVFVLMYSKFMDEIIMRGNISAEDYIKLVNVVPVLLQPHPDRMFTYADKILARVRDENLRKQVLATVDMSRCSENVLRQAVHRSFIGNQEFYANRKTSDINQPSSKNQSHSQQSPQPPPYPSAKSDRQSKESAGSTPKQVDMFEVASMSNMSTNNQFDWKAEPSSYQQQEIILNPRDSSRHRIGKNRTKYSRDRMEDFSKEKPNDLLSSNVNQKYHLARRYSQLNNTPESLNFNSNYRGRNMSTGSSSIDRNYHPKLWPDRSESKSYYGRNEDTLPLYDKHRPKFTSRFQISKPRSEEHLYARNKSHHLSDFGYQMPNQRREQNLKRIGMNEFNYGYKFGSLSKLPVSGRSKSPLSSLSNFSNGSTNLNHLRKMPYSYHPSPHQFMY